MPFSDKLDFLMNITKTSNSTLSLYTALDASHISRLRRGQRSLSKNGDYARSMAAYFAKRCVEDYQRKALFDILNINQYATEDPELSEMILDWFLEEKTSDLQSVDSFLTNFSAFNCKKSPPPTTGAAEVVFPLPDTAVYFGVPGKRQAVLNFLSEVIAHRQPQTLYLFSDEDMGWLTDSREFTARWANLMVQVIARGSRIRIIHTVSRDLDEMLNAISKWMPLYMSGAIEPYYYPKKRDGIFKRTLFVAPETAAVVSSSLGSSHDQAANHLYRDPQTVAAFQEEFQQYLKLCKPLMRIYTARDEKAYLAALLEFEKEPADTVIKTESLSLLTMPEESAASFISRHCPQKEGMIACHRERLNRFRHTLQKCQVTEIIDLPDVASVLAGKIKIAFSDMLCGSSAFYTADEYRLHLENIICLLESNENFHVCLEASGKKEGYMVYVKEDRGTLVSKTSFPPVILAMDESNMNAAFWDFLQMKIDGKLSGQPGRAETIRRLENYLKRLQAHTVVGRSG